MALWFRPDGTMTSAHLGRYVALTTFGNLVPPLAGLVIAPLLAQSLGVTGRGELAAANAVLLVATIAAAFGLPEALTYFVARGRDYVGGLLARSGALLLLAGIVGTAVLMAAAPLLSGGDDRVVGLIRLAILALTPALLVGGLRGAAAGCQAWGLISADRILAALVRLAAVALLALSGSLTPESAVAAIAVSYFIGAAVYIRLPALVRQLPGCRPDGPVSDSGLFRYGMVLWPGALTGILLMRADQLLLAPLAGVAELGIYAVAATIAEVSLVFNAAVKDVIFSAESADQDEHRLGAAARISTLITVLVAAGLIALSAWAVPQFFGTDFLPAVPVLCVLLAGTVLGNPGSVAGAGLGARGRPGLRSWSLGAALLANVLLLMLLAGPWGAMGAAIAALAGNVLAGGLNVLWLWRCFAIPPGLLLRPRRSDLWALGQGLRTATGRLSVRARADRTTRVP
ncbi:lipopolysaccharide biosynthesis protein [Arthrobacter sp. CAU 1506]|uniref:oligosaccharide flippase family protein n=1 Tax=Arthrobacter sp. CAU 1506 TaxID=2560052 RepID=UPI0010AC1A22|nr:oligosaccharide flippase family protein [Arthrobacter sp. CAU 1506]TJY72368.1 lipopolysaccharide biosynthesis protein [Arthrobacter sp. CAU 1506]